MKGEPTPAGGRGLLGELAGELVASALLVVIAFASGAVRVQLGEGTIGGALLGSIGGRFP